MSGTVDAPNGVVTAIRDSIEANGPITFAEFMELSLYGAGGFYEIPPVGPRGDFITSPHVHPVFGRLLADAIRELWDLLGRPAPLRLAEVGAGDGTLAGSLLPGVAFPISYAAIDRSPGARSALATIGGVDVRTELQGAVDVVLCNELLDNLPFRVVRGDREVRVGIDGDRFVEVLEPAGPDIVAHAATDDQERIVPVGAFDFVDSIAGALDPGFALLIDYGGVGDAGGPLHGYRGHTVIEDVLATPGGTDITAGVDFELIASHAVDRGLIAFTSVRQRDALLALGIDGWLQDELRRQQMQLGAGEGRDAVRTWSGRSRATLLLDRGGLGRSRWLLLATPGLQPPNWLLRALDASGPELED